MRIAIRLWFLGMAATVTDGRTCSTTGPGGLQRNSARIGGTQMQLLTDIVDADACSEACCNFSPCRSWTWSAGICELMEGYAALHGNLSATSGVVYREDVQAAPWSSLRGFNYVPPQSVNDIDMWRDYDHSVVERDMAIAQRTGFNFARVFLNFHVWDAERDMFLEKVRHFLASAHSYGIDVMLIPFDLCWFGCRSHVVSVNSSGKCWYPSPQFSLADDKTWWLAGESYVDALVAAFPAGTPGLLLWDVVNEPESGGQSGLPGEQGVRWTFVRKFVEYVRSKTTTPTTVGVAIVSNLEHVADVVDVLSFHSYHDTWELGLQRTEIALQFAREYSKPVFNSETGCIARGNAFDQTMEMCTRNGMGFAVWELMISDCLDCVGSRRWKHGLLFSDGTTRDPAAIAALHGVYVNRGERVPLAVPRPDMEGEASNVANDIANWIAQGDIDEYYDGVALLDKLSNLVESSITIPMVQPPSASARQLAAEGETTENRLRLRELLTDLVEPLKVTKMGKESGPGICVFEGTPKSCQAMSGCTLHHDTELDFIEYSPPTTQELMSCWTSVAGTPTDTGDAGSIHYCRLPNSTFKFTVGGDGGAPRQADVVMVYKAGPDCGFLDVSVDGQNVSRIDTYSADVDWEARVTLLKNVDLALSAHILIGTVVGLQNPLSSNAWVQLSAIELLLHTSVSETNVV